MWATVVGAVFGSLGLGSVLGWWLTQWFGLGIAHKHRVIEKHAEKLHDYATKYYAKVTVVVEFTHDQMSSIATLLQKGEVPSDDCITCSLFGLARLSKLEEVWFQEISSTLLLNSRTAERLICQLRKLIEESLYDKLACLNMESDAILRGKIGVYESFSAFKGKLEDKELRQIYQKYKATITATKENEFSELDSLISALNCLYRIMYFEVNTCFDPWYRKKTQKPCLKEADLVTLNIALNELERKGYIDSKSKKDYLKRIGAEKFKNPI
jgi:hypothetical protein